MREAGAAAGDISRDQAWESREGPITERDRKTDKGSCLEVKGITVAEITRQGK